MKDRVQLKITRQGDVTFHPTAAGYIVGRGEDVVAFYIDPQQDCSIACTGNWYGEDPKGPSVSLEHDGENPNWTTVEFPEYPGWYVHSVWGGKTVGICLVKS